MSEKVRINRDHITITGLEVIDYDAARVLEDRLDEAREDLVRRALRIGTLAIRDAAVGVNVDVVQKEFERLVIRIDQRNDVYSSARCQDHSILGQQSRFDRPCRKQCRAR